MKIIRRKFEDWMTLVTYAEADQPEMGFQITGAEAPVPNSLAANSERVVTSGQRAVPDAAREVLEPLSDTPAATPKSRKNKLEVMVVDDEPIVGKRLKPALTRYGYNVEVFENPVKAIDRFDQKDFDVVVTDLRMDDIDGIKVLEHVMTKSKKTKVIFITGYATVENAREALVKGAFDFIAKPFRPNDLRLAITKAALSLGYGGELAGAVA